MQCGVEERISVVVSMETSYPKDSISYEYQIMSNSGFSAREMHEIKPDCCLPQMVWVR